MSDTPTRRAFAASARSAVAPFHVMRVWAAAAERAKQGLPVFNLTAGQPSTPAPQPVIAAAHRAIDERALGYTETPGISPLREAIAGHYAHRYDLDVDPRQVYVTTGSSGGFLLAFLAAFGPGDRVGLIRPGYPAYRNILQALGCEVVELPCGPESGYQPSLETIAAGHLDGLIVASPANPTGSTLSAGQLAAITEYCARQGIRFLSDEIYHGINYVGTDRCSWSTDRSGIVINSFSKYFSMTGWRIGWLLLPDDLLDAVDALAGNLSICPPAPAQYAAVAAFDGYAECDGHVVRYAENRTLLLDGLHSLGLTDLAPADGAFYVYADLGGLVNDSERFCFDLLDKTGVAIAPGIDFDPAEGHHTVRFSFAGTAASIEGGLTGLGQYLRAGA